MEFIDKLKRIFKENDIEVLEYQNEKQPIKYRCLKCKKIYEYKCARNLLSKITLCKNCYNPFNRWNKNRLAERLKRIYPSSSLEIISFNSMRNGGTIKCKKCNTEEKINNFEALFIARADYFCNNCEKEKNLILKHLYKELEKGKLELLNWTNTNEKAKFKCLRCGHIFEKNVKLSFNGDICPNCFKVYNKFSFDDAQKVLDYKGNGEYKLLQYKGTNFKSLVKHNCGFCFSTRLANFEKIRGCPKCYRKISKGKKDEIK